MDLILWIAISLVTLALAVWLSRLAMLSKIDRYLPSLNLEMYRDAVGDLPPLSILVAAKDEASNIETCLRSLLMQDYPNLKIIAVNDRSVDGTGEIMDRLAAENDRLTVCHVSRLDAGWFGKNNAMRQGVAHASSPWLCFTDADCVLKSSRTLSVAMRYAMENEADFLSVLPFHQANTFWERVIQPACSGILMLWFNPMIVNNPKRKTAYANGAFMLMQRSCYDSIGGHDAVKSEVNEDMHMARIAKESGQRLVVVSNKDLYSVRMYGTFSESWSGWTRIFYGCFRTIRRLALVTVVLIEFSLVPWAALLLSLALRFTGGAEGEMLGRLLWIALAACVIQLCVMSTFYAMSRINFLYGFTYPLGAFLGMALLINAMRCAKGRSVFTWRGTTYRAGAIDTSKDPLTADST